MARAPGAAGRARRASPSTWPSWRLDAQLPARRSCSTRPARCGPSWPRWRPRASAAWAPTRTPTAACCCATCELPDFRDYAVDVPRARHAPRARRRACSAGFLRDVMTREPGPLPRLRPRRDGVQPAGRRVRGDRPPVGGRAPAHRRPPGARGPRDGGAQRAHVPGLAGGLPADRPPRPVQLLRGLHPHRRLDVQPARQVAEGHARHPVAAADRVAQLPAQLARLAPGPQRLLAPGPRLHRPRGQQEGRDRPRLPAPRRQLPAVGRRPLPAQPPLRERDRGRQAAGARLPDDGRGDRALHARHRHLGLGVERRRRRARRGAGLRRRHPDARDAGRRGDPARAASPT